MLHAWDAGGDGLVWAFSSDVEARSAGAAVADEGRQARRRDVNELLREAMADGPWPPGAGPTPRLERGAPEDVIEAQCKALDADVVVMGTVARTGLSGVFIGNTAENIINSLDRSVVAVKPEGFVSPLATG